MNDEQCRSRHKSQEFAVARRFRDVEFRVSAIFIGTEAPSIACRSVERVGDRNAV